MPKDYVNAAARLLGERLREVRRAAGLTQAQLSERSKISEEYISCLERGVANPTLDTMVLVAGALGSEVCDLVRSPLHAE